MVSCDVVCVHDALALLLRLRTLLRWGVGLPPLREDEARFVGVLDLPLGVLVGVEPV